MRVMVRWNRLAGACAIAAGCTLPVVSASADAVGDFYKGKTITLIISVGEGDGMDKAARIIARHWALHIPGNPNIVPKNMPGAGGLRATNFLYSQAPKDGTAIGAIIPAFVMQQILGGGAVDYDSSKFQWIGSSNTSNSMIYVWHTTGVTSLEGAMTKELVMGGTGAGSNSVHYPAILDHILGTKFKVVMGYRGSPDINLAVERGEVQGRAGETFNTLLINNPDWVKDKKVNILVQIGQTKEAGFENVPLLTEFAKNPISREVLGLFSEEVALGRPYLAPPGVPEDRVAALRASFEVTMQDPAMLADAQRLRLDLAPTSGEKLEKLVENMVNTRPDVLERAKAALEIEDLVGGKDSGGKNNER
jgi:tripartite-type tricarboxylate transporter receptor subunit TctC